MNLVYIIVQLAQQLFVQLNIMSAICYVHINLIESDTNVIFTK